MLDLIAQGLDNRRIADRLILSQKTVANHVSSIFAKLEVADRAQAIVKARDAGMGQRPEQQGLASRLNLPAFREPHLMPPDWSRRTLDVS